MSNNQIDDEAMKSTPDASSVPTLGGVDDDTIASPELGYGLQRIDFVDTREDSDMETRVVPRIPAAPKDVAPDTLGRNEVAAVSVDRTYYVTDQPSPYLTSRQAQEDVYQTRRRRSTVVKVIVTAFVLAALGAGGYFVWTFTKTDAPRQAVKYDTREIEFGEFVDSIDATSLIQPIDERTVMPSVSGTVAEVFVEEGAYVEEGAQLFRLDNPTITDAVVKAEAALASFQSEADAANQALAGAEGELAKAQEAYDTIELQLKEAKAEDDESDSDADKDDADDGSDEDSDEDSDSEDDKDKDDKEKSSKSKADPATIRALEESEKRAEGSLKIARDIADRFRMEAETANANLYNVQQAYYVAVEQQETLTIYAPISGFVTELNAAAAPSSAVSGSTRMCVVSDTSCYRVQIEIPRESADRVSIGEEVRIAFPAIEDLNITSSVASIDVSGEALLATILIEQPDERISSGVAAEVRLVLNSIPDSLMVPLEALRTAEDGSTHLDVLLDATRNIVTDVPVTVVATNSTHAAITAANIQRGNTVVVTPTTDAPETPETPEADAATPAEGEAEPNAEG
jgi:multidrug efflux pump subunit AcrA (membrane-fusion protein)